MVTANSPGGLRVQAQTFFREEPLPEALSWVADLSPLNLRLFVVELSDALKRVLLTDDDSGLDDLIDAWRSTAELDAAPEVLERVRRPKEYRPLSEFRPSA